MSRYLPQTRIGAFFIVGAALVGLPILALPVMLSGKYGFGAYLAISDAYFRLPAMVFGGAHFARREFGMIPTSTLAYFLAAALYAAVALLLCWLVPLRPTVSE